MLNPGTVVDDVKTLEYVNPSVEHAMQSGIVNVSDDGILANINHSIRLGYPQMRPGPPQSDEICLVGSGPSLNATFDELRELYFAGCKIVTMNGAYQWCLEKNIRPSTQIVLDARPSNARFLSPAIPQCRYVLASQCAPETWATVRGRESVWIFHAAVQTEGPIRTLLDTYYNTHWFGVGGGVTVATRALTLLNMCGYRRFHLFGVDSCWLGKEHHALPQPENAADQRFRITVDDPQVAGSAKQFVLSPWHLKQVEDFIALIKVNGEHFLLDVRGEGILAHLMRLGACASMQITEEAITI